jgi:hypothetical protein
VNVNPKTVSAALVLRPKSAVVAHFKEAATQEGSKDS